MKKLLDNILERFSSVYANSKNLKEAIDELNNTYEKISSTMNEKTKQLYDSIINTISSLTKINSQLGALKKTIDDIEIPSSSQTDIFKSSKSKARLLLDPSNNISNKILLDATKVQQAKTAEQIAKDAQEARKKEEELAKKIAELQAEQEKMALEKKIKAEKDKEERIKLKTEAAQKELIFSSS